MPWGMQDNVVECKIIGEKIHLNVKGAWWKFQGIDKREAEGRQVKGYKEKCLNEKWKLSWGKRIGGKY